MISQVSLGASLSMGSGSHLDRVGCVLQAFSYLSFLLSRTDYQDCDRESASNTAMAGYSLTGSVASSYLGHQRLEVGTFLRSGLTLGSVLVLDFHLDSIRLEQMFTRGKSSPSPVKDSARLSPSGSSFLDFVPS